MAVESELASKLLSVQFQLCIYHLRCVEPAHEGRAAAHSLHSAVYSPRALSTSCSSGQPSSHPAILSDTHLGHLPDGRRPTTLCLLRSKTLLCFHSFAPIHQYSNPRSIKTVTTTAIQVSLAVSMIGNGRAQFLWPIFGRDRLSTSRIFRRHADAGRPRNAGTQSSSRQQGKGREVATY